MKDRLYHSSRPATPPLEKASLEKASLRRKRAPFLTDFCARVVSFRACIPPPLQLINDYSIEKASFEKPYFPNTTFARDRLHAVESGSKTLVPSVGGSLSQKITIEVVAGVGPSTTRQSARKNNSCVIGPARQFQNQKRASPKKAFALERLHLKVLHTRKASLADYLSSFYYYTRSKRLHSTGSALLRGGPKPWYPPSGGFAFSRKM